MQVLKKINVKIYTMNCDFSSYGYRKSFEISRPLWYHKLWRLWA